MITLVALIVIIAINIHYFIKQRKRFYYTREEKFPGILFKEYYAKCDTPAAFYLMLIIISMAVDLTILTINIK